MRVLDTNQQHADNPLAGQRRMHYVIIQAAAHGPNQYELLACWLLLHALRKQLLPVVPTKTTSTWCRTQPHCRQNEPANRGLAHLGQEGVEAEDQLLVTPEQVLHPLDDARGVDPLGQEGETGAPCVALSIEAGGFANMRCCLSGAALYNCDDAAAELQAAHLLLLSMDLRYWLTTRANCCLLCASCCQFLTQPLHAAHLWALNSFMISRNVSYTSFLSLNLFLTSRKYVNASLVVSRWAPGPCCVGPLRAASSGRPPHGVVTRPWRQFMRMRCWRAVAGSYKRESHKDITLNLVRWLMEKGRPLQTVISRRGQTPASCITPRLPAHTGRQACHKQPTRPRGACVGGW